MNSVWIITKDEGDQALEVLPQFYKTKGDAEIERRKIIFNYLVNYDKAIDLQR